MEKTTETRWLDPDERALWLALREFVWDFPTAMDRQLQRDSGMLNGEYGVLATLSECPTGTMRPAEAAALMGWERSRLSHLLRRMEAKGLVSRCASEEDKRGQEISLTDAGWDAIRKAAPGHVTFVREVVFDQLDGTEREVLGRVLAKITAAAHERGLLDPREVQPTR